MEQTGFSAASSGLLWLAWRASEASACAATSVAGVAGAFVGGGGGVWVVVALVVLGSWSADETQRLRHFRWHLVLVLRFHGWHFQPKQHRHRRSKVRQRGPAAAGTVERWCVQQTGSGSSAAGDGRRWLKWRAPEASARAATSSGGCLLACLLACLLLGAGCCSATHPPSSRRRGTDQPTSGKRTNRDKATNPSKIRNTRTGTTQTQKRKKKNRSRAKRQCMSSLFFFLFIN